MAAATARPNPLTSAQQRFAYIVSRGSGLSWKVVEAWVLAEGQPAGTNNFLNLRDAKTKQFRSFSSPDDAAKATIDNLRTPLYRPVVLSQKGSDTDQLKAIAASKWDTNHYSGRGSQGSLLLGTYKRVTGTSPPTITGSHGEAFSGAKYVAGAADLAAGDTGLASSETGLTSGGILGGVENVGVKLLAYLVLSGVAVGLFVIGASRATGIVPGEFSALRADQRGAIPF